MKSIRIKQLKIIQQFAIARADGNLCTVKNGVGSPVPKDFVSVYNWFGIIRCILGFIKRQRPINRAVPDKPCCRLSRNRKAHTVMPVEIDSLLHIVGTSFIHGWNDIFLKEVLFSEESRFIGKALVNIWVIIAVVFKDLKQSLLKEKRTRNVIRVAIIIDTKDICRLELFDNLLHVADNILTLILCAVIVCRMIG